MTERKWEGVVHEIDRGANTFFAILNEIVEPPAPEPPESFGTFGLSQVSDEDQSWVKLGAVFIWDGRALVFSHAVWTRAEMDQVSKRAAELMKIFGKAPAKTKKEDDK